MLAANRIIDGLQAEVGLDKTFDNEWGNSMSDHDSNLAHQADTGGEVPVGLSAQASRNLYLETEINGLARSLELEKPAQMWYTALDLTRADNGSGAVSQAALYAQLSGSDYPLEQFQTDCARWDGIFWQRSRDNLYLASRRKAHHRLMNLAASEK